MKKRFFVMVYDKGRTSASPIVDEAGAVVFYKTVKEADKGAKIATIDGWSEYATFTIMLSDEAGK